MTAEPARTKIVATLGPASRSPETVEKLIAAGVDVFRINAAHSDHKTMRRDIRTVRRIAKRLRAGIGVLVDLQGPKIRVGPLQDAEPIWLHNGSRLVISTAEGVVGTVDGGGEGVARIGCGYAALAKDVRPKDRMLLDDGYIELRVEAVEGHEITAKVVHGGLLKQYKGINLPGTQVSAKSLTRKDLEDLDFVLDQPVDFIAISFVRTPQDISRVRNVCEERGADVRIIAKIERPEAVDNLAKILDVADGLMVARGDMGVELGPEVVPAIQKRIIRLANEARKPVITATQMLESMIMNPRPTRAEASDVANAIYDGTSAVMLSAETATGKYPVQTVKIMDGIINRAEEDLFQDWEYARRRSRREITSSVTMSTVRAAAYAALESNASVIAVVTESGTTATMVAGERTPTRIVAFTPFQSTVQRLALTWGVAAFRVSRFRTSHEMTLQAEELLLEEGIAKVGERVVFIVGSTRNQGLANVMILRTLGENDDADSKAGQRVRGGARRNPAGRAGRRTKSRKAGAVAEQQAG